MAGDLISKWEAEVFCKVRSGSPIGRNREDGRQMLGPVASHFDSDKETFLMYVIDAHSEESNGSALLG
jgi:hypothetical protein